jgi:hypothetical protein
MEAGFIAMLKVALMGVLIATFVAPLAGMVDTTEGTVTVSWPHPAMKTTSNAASEYIIPNLILRICPSRPTVVSQYPYLVRASAWRGAPTRHDLAKVTSWKLPSLSEIAHFCHHSY